jgi:putative transposase
MSMTDEVTAEPVSGKDAMAALRASGALDEVLAAVDAGSVQLDGKDGLVQELIKAVLERGLQTELADHLGYEKGDPEAAEFANSRNGNSAKSVATTVGTVDLDIPRDRFGTFIPRLVPKGQRRLGGLDDVIISFYAGGMTIRDIQHHLRSTIGTELSPETISKITDAVLDEVMAWQRRPLDALYPIMYLDALVIKVRDGNQVSNRAAHIAVGVDMDGIKHVLGIWIQAHEGAKFWAGVCAELANRGVKDVLIVCTDGLSGFPEAIEATWPQVTVQTSSMHYGCWRDGSADHLHHRGQDLCKRVTFEVQMQTRPLAVVAGF